MTIFRKNRTLRALSPPGLTARLAVAVAFAGFVAAACDVHTPTDPGTLFSITVTPNVTLAINATQQFVAVGRDAENRVVSFSPTWSIAAGGGAISSAGLFTAGTAPGTFTSTVMAASGGVSGTANVTVIIGALATITITTPPATLPINATLQYAAVGNDAGGNVVAINPSWSIVAGGGAISPAGLFTAGTVPGTFGNSVRVAEGSISATATVIVTTGTLASIAVTPNPDSIGAGANQQFTAVGRDAGNNVITITPSWSVVAGGGSIGSGGLFSAGLVLGSFPNTVRASSGAISGTATVVVIPGVLASITVTPNPDTLPINAAQQFTAVGRDAGNNVVSILPSWSVVAGGGNVNSSGLFTAGIALGDFPNTVRAASGAISGSASVTVIAGALASIAVTPNPDTLNASATQLFAAVGRDAGNNVVPIVPVWSVVNGGGAIDNAGLFTAGGVAGTFNNTVRAQDGLVSGFATVVVNVVVVPPLVPLGAAAPNGIMAGQAVTCINTGLISADISISPGSTLNGFGPGECVATGVLHLGDAVALAGQNDLTTAYNTLMGLPCPTPANAIVADLGGTTIQPGVYCTASGIGVTGVVTLNGLGDPNANFVFQAGTTIVTAGDVVLIGGAQAKNVYWVSGTSITLGTASQWQGNSIALASITLVDNATLLGRALARNGSVTLGTGNTITLP